MLSPSGLAQRDQVLRIKLQLGMKVEGFDMMNLQFSPPITTGHANWLAAQVFLLYPGPFRTSLMSMQPGYTRSMIQFF